MPSNESQEPKKLNSPNKVILSSPSNKTRNEQQSSQFPSSSEDITAAIIQQIDSLSGGFSDYPIRKLVEHAQQFGPHLKSKKLETNQIRKFLDALNQIKAKLTQIDEDEQARFQKIETDIVLLQPKLAYASARQDSVTALSRVMAKAIDKVRTTDDFERLVQFLESTIAYHKAENGK